MGEEVGGGPAAECEGEAACPARTSMEALLSVAVGLQAQLAVLRLLCFGSAPCHGLSLNQQL